MVLHPASTIVALILRNIHHILFHLPANQPSVVITKKTNQVGRWKPLQDNFSENAVCFT